MSNRIRIKTKNDWSKLVSMRFISPDEARAMRMAVYNEIQQLRKRPLIVYYSQFIRNINAQTPVGIDFADIDGFTDLVYSIPEGSDTVDVLLHSPGGMAEVTERIVYILRKRFKEVHFLIPHSAYSAATMLALSGNSITLHPEATLGPIDPQIFDSPARSILKGFEIIKKAILKEGTSSVPVYQPLLDKFSVQQLEQCKDVVKLTKTLVAEWLRDYMLNDGQDNTQQIKKAINYFADSDLHLTHRRSVFYKDVAPLGLKIEESKGELTVLLREAFLIIDCGFENFPVAKFYENTHGIGWAILRPAINNLPGMQQQQPEQQQIPTKPAQPHHTQHQQKNKK